MRQTLPKTAEDIGPNQAAPQICLDCRFVFCFHKSLLFSYSFSIFSLSSPICIHIKLIPPSLSCCLCVSHRGRLRNTGENGCSQPLCLLQWCALQQLKSPIPIQNPQPQANVCPVLLGGCCPRSPSNMQGVKVWANLSTELHHIKSEHDQSEILRQVSHTLPTRQLIPVKLCKTQRYRNVSVECKFIFLAWEEVIISFLEIATPFCWLPFALRSIYLSEVSEGRQSTWEMLMRMIFLSKSNWKLKIGRNKMNISDKVMTKCRSQIRWTQSGYLLNPTRMEVKSIWRKLIGQQFKTGKDSSSSYSGERKVSAPVCSPGQSLTLPQLGTKCWVGGTAAVAQNGCSCALIVGISWE